MTWSPTKVPWPTIQFTHLKRTSEVCDCCVVGFALRKKMGHTFKVVQTNSSLLPTVGSLTDGKDALSKATSLCLPKHRQWSEDQ